MATQRPLLRRPPQFNESARLGLARLPLELLELALQELDRQADEEFQPQVQTMLAIFGARLMSLADKHALVASGDNESSPAQIHEEACNAPADFVTSNRHSATAAIGGCEPHGEEEQETGRVDDELVEGVRPPDPSANTVNTGTGTSVDGQQEAAKEDDEDGQLPVKQWSPHDLIQVFNRLDSDGSGQVGGEELSATLRRAGVSDREVRELMRIADTSGDGLISRAEFLKAADSPQLRAFFKKMRSSPNLSDLDPPQYSYMLSYSSFARICWDFLCASMLSYMAISEPVFLAFPNSRNISAVSGIATAIDVVFLLDVALNFRTTFCTADGFEVVDPRKVAKNYIKTWFALDLISSIPYDALSLDGFANLQPLRLLKYWKVARVLKMIKVSTALANATQSDFALDIMDSLRKARVFQCLPLISISLLTCVVCHWLACFMIASGDGFLYDYQDVSGDPRSEYISALYWGFTTITTVGYGDITPGSDRERLYAIIAMSVGGAFYGYFIARFTTIVTHSEFKDQVYEEKLYEVYSWLEYHQFPTPLRKRMRRYFERHLKLHSMIDDESMLKALSPELQSEVAEHIISLEVRHHPIFSDLPAGAMPRMAKILRRVEVDASETIVRQGDVGGRMYIILSGEVQLEPALVDTNRLGVGRSEIPEISHLSTCDSFGAELFASPGHAYNYTATAQTHVVMDAIPVDDFRHQFKDYPDVWHQVQLKATSSDERHEEKIVLSHKPFELETLELLRQIQDSHDQLQAALRQDIQSHLIRAAPHIQSGTSSLAKRRYMCTL